MFFFLCRGHLIDPKPQFDNLGYPERHGFARNRLWELDTCPSPLPRSNNHSSVDLILKSTDEDLKTWPHRYYLRSEFIHMISDKQMTIPTYKWLPFVCCLCSFELRLRVILHPSKLTLIPRVRNTGSKDFSFTFAIQNYLSMSDVRYAYTYSFFFLKIWWLHKFDIFIISLLAFFFFSHPYHILISMIIWWHKYLLFHFYS